jgi:outer membrane protein TolC
MLFILYYSVILAQNSITLKECYERAYVSAAISNEKEVYRNIWQLKDNNLSKGWLPTVDVNGNLVYNSSVVDMTEVLGSLPFPGISDLINPLPHEQYKITLDVNQMIYDGGSVKSARALERVEGKIKEMQTEIDLYKLRSQINGYFFNLLLIDRQKELLQNYLELINKRIASIGSALESGVILKSDTDVLVSERIKLEQQLTENAIRKASLLKILSGLIGDEIHAATQFAIPAVDEEFTDELFRPELQIFDLRKEQLDASKQLIQSKRMPKAFGFATFGYGNPPGSNFFKDEFAPFFIVGAGVKWNIYDWNRAKNERQIISLQQDLIDGRKSDLTDNLKRLLDAKSAEISSLKSLVETDTELIGLRKRIAEAAESQYSNGAITATEYLNELNAERQALISHEIHKINLALARVEYLNICGKEITE